jgi:hypothetical protein
VTKSGAQAADLLCWSFPLSILLVLPPAHRGCHTW